MDTVVGTAGRHVIIELWGCDAEILSDPQAVLAGIRDAALATGATIVLEHVHDFGGGASAMCVLAESHASTHTWPNEGYASVDFYTCGKCDPLLAIPVIKRAFGATRVVAGYIDRGTAAGLRLAKVSGLKVLAA